MPRGADPSLGATCHAMITAAGEEPVTAARRTGDVRADVDAVDLFEPANALSPAAEADRLLTPALDGIRPPPEGLPGLRVCPA